MASHRQLAHETEYDDAVASLVRDNPRYRDVIDGIEWKISTGAETFPLSRAEENGIADIRVAPSDPVGGLDSIHVIFTIDDADNATLMYAGAVVVDEI